MMQNSHQKTKKLIKTTMKTQTFSQPVTPFLTHFSFTKSQTPQSSMQMKITQKKSHTTLSNDSKLHTKLSSSTQTSSHSFMTHCGLFRVIFSQNTQNLTSNQSTLIMKTSHKIMRIRSKTSVKSHTSSQKFTPQTSQTLWMLMWFCMGTNCHITQ